MILVVCYLSRTDVIWINRLNGRVDWDHCDEKIIIKITGMVRLSGETWVTKAIGETRISRVMR